MKTVRKMLTAAVAAGYVLSIEYGDEIDYQGTNVQEAIDAIEACDEMEVAILDDGHNVGWALIISDLDEDEQIADCSGWISDWCDENA